jgi:hypothetical protein
VADDLHSSLSPRLCSRARVPASASLGVPRFFAQNGLRGSVWRGWRGRTRWALLGLVLGAAGLLWHGWPRAEPLPSVALDAPRLESSTLAALEPAPAPLPGFVRAPEPLELEDGSSVELHTASSALRTEEWSDDRMRVRLSGGARFDVAPEPRSFVVESAQVLVRALGASAFSVDPDDARTRVAVERGRVQIMWWSGATILQAGDSALFPPENESAFGRRDNLERKPRHARHVKHAKQTKHVRHAKHVSKHAKHASKHAKHASKHRKSRGERAKALARPRTS